MAKSERNAKSGSISRRRGADAVPKKKKGPSPAGKAMAGILATLLFLGSAVLWGMELMREFGQ